MQLCKKSLNVERLLFKLCCQEEIFRMLCLKVKIPGKVNIKQYCERLFRRKEEYHPWGFVCPLIRSSPKKIKRERDYFSLTYLPNFFKKSSESKYKFEWNYQNIYYWIWIFCICSIIIWWLLLSNEVGPISSMSSWCFAVFFLFFEDNMCVHMCLCVCISTFYSHTNSCLK